jgi:hypothetical protein
VSIAGLKRQITRGETGKSRGRDSDDLIKRRGNGRFWRTFEPIRAISVVIDKASKMSSIMAIRSSSFFFGQKPIVVRRQKPHPKMTKNLFYPPQKTKRDSCSLPLLHTRLSVSVHLLLRL